GTVCVVGKMRDLILQLSKSSIYSTKPLAVCVHTTLTVFSRYTQGNGKLVSAAKCLRQGRGN
ncbi:hypothetical protein AAGP94_26610, partial [Klebsiella pneumoniae]